MVDRTPVPRKISIENTTPDLALRERKSFSILKTFGVDLGENEDGSSRDQEVVGYSQPTEHTPTLNPNYVFPRDPTLALLLGMTCQDPVLLVGHTGTGKTSLVEQVAARINYDVIKVSYDCAVTRSDVIGEWVVKGNEMEFQYGVVPMAIQRPGTILLLDEWDAQNAETAYALQRLMQKEDRKLFVLETKTLIPMHPDNVICATANTNGQGDDTGLYGAGTRVQSYASLNRFQTTIKLDFLPPEEEARIIYNTFPGEGLDKIEVDAIIQAIGKVRDGFANNQLSVPLSTRDAINWADKYVKFGDIMRAATFCFLNRMSDSDARVTEQIIRRIFHEDM